MKIPDPVWRLLSAISLSTLLALPASALEVGEKAPIFSATTLSGQDLELARIIGEKPVYIKFWATWCKYCVRELPHAQSVYKRYADDIVMIMVNVGLNDSIENINRVYRDNNIDIPTLIDTTGNIVSDYAVVGTPNHLLIDKNGRLAYRSFLVTDELDRRLEAMANATEREAKP